MNSLISPAGRVFEVDIHTGLCAFLYHIYSGNKPAV